MNSIKPAATVNAKNQPKPTITKKERRKVSHSVIEKRRRERINYCISQLNVLVPSCHAEDNLQKLAVLEKTVEYIRTMQGIKTDLHPYPLSPTNCSVESESQQSTMSINNLIN